MSERITWFLPSLISPIAIPAVAVLSGTPASINANDPAQTVAIEDDPFDSSISETSLIVYGNSDFPGISVLNPLSASVP